MTDITDHVPLPPAYGEEFNGAHSGVAEMGGAFDPDVPFVNRRDAFGPSPDAGPIEAAPEPAPFKLPPLTIAEWLDRDLPEPDFLLGSWLTTTTRGLLVAPTGLGKTNFAMALAIHTAAGMDFLHWQGRRPARVLYIDGEMARRLYRERIRDAVNRIGELPAGFHALSREDLDDLKPLNTPEGHAVIEKIIAAIGGVDLIVFDAIMCLLAGDMKDGEAWAQVMPWVRSLTKRNIGQVWVHHTGHDATRSYGDKTREWQMDTVLHMEAVENTASDVSFALEFRKARERTPATRADFQTATIALSADQWVSDVSRPNRKGRVQPLGFKFLDALNNALAGEVGITTAFGQRAVKRTAWQSECVHLGLIELPSDANSADGKKQKKAAQTLFNKYRQMLVAANYIACNEDLAWLV